MSEPSVKQILRWLTSITRPVHAPLLASTMFRFAYLTLEILLFGVAGWGVAKIAQGEGSAHLLLWLVVIAVVKALSFYLEQFLGHYVAFKALELLRGHSFAKLWPKAPGILLHSRSGDLLASLTADVQRIEVVYAHTFAPVVSAVVVPTAVLITVGATVSWPLVAIPALCYLVSIAVVPVLGIRRSFAATDAALRARGELTAHVTDSIFGIEEVVGYGRQESRLAETDEISDVVNRHSRTPAYYRGLRRGLNLLLLLVSTTAVVGVGMHLELALPLLVGLAAGSLRLFEGPRGVEDAVGALDASIASARRLWHLTHAPEPVTSGSRDFPELGGGVEWRDVTYTYPSSRTAHVAAVKNVTVTAPAGKHTVFVGTSGSGKTTALQLLLRFDDPDSGQVLIGGVPVRELKLGELRSNVVLVQQRNQLLDTTIAENLRLGAPTASDDDLWWALTVAELDAEVRAMPDGLETKVGQDGSQLSGGQAQRLSLARALLMRPAVLLFDEFTSNLNVELARTIRANLASEFPGLTTIEVTHRVSEAADADVIYRFDSGRAEQVSADQVVS
ncbi:ABC transporter ATP-binding protein [Trueperella bialowiezensis]|uniref:Probable ABC transporter ATP-binding protein HI_0664 n=1 Tax=Trueperella bialowiezensis TaxID=312285 RepID=A0A3S4X5U6_9ACTO|nr:ABC transporter ATP-binding protein [Trueperella bialowiezensis]VEI13315.1 Probable ABC transporter ATP-binding protein HI_0664 [Trueperella bialowiezensis]